MAMHIEIVARLLWAALFLLSSQELANATPNPSEREAGGVAGSCLQDHANNASVSAINRRAASAGPSCFINDHSVYASTGAELIARDVAPGRERDERIEGETAERDLRPIRVNVARDGQSDWFY